MDKEAQIQAQLIAKMPSSQPSEPMEHTPDEPGDPAPPGMTPEASLDRIKLLDYFGISSIDRHSPEADNYLTKIMEWARDEAGSSEYTDILRVISDTERTLGIRFKEGRLTTLFRLVTIRHARNQLAEQERALYNG